MNCRNCNHLISKSVASDTGYTHKYYGVYKAEFSRACMKHICHCVDPEPTIQKIRTAKENQS
jgi:hypothetical protein